MVIINRRRNLFLYAVVVFSAVIRLSACSGEKTGSGSDSKEALQEVLGESIDQDTRIIYAEYDELNDDLAAYKETLAEELTEDDEKYARRNLMQQHMESEFQEALRNHEEKVCVVGWLNSLGGYINSSNLLAYDNGVFRTMPYSTFWLKSYECVTGWLPKGDSDDDASDVPYYVYTFEYYPLSDDEIRDIESRIDQAADEIMDCVPIDADLWQKCRIIHDELIRRTEYDSSFEEHCHDLYGALVNHKTVCEGYALAFKYILNRMGEDCKVVVSNWDEQPDSITHAWNQINDNTYERYIDVTWDDLGYTDNNGNAIIGYDYFGLTQEEIEQIENHAFNENLITTYADPHPFNYYRHEGLVMDLYDESRLTELFGEQYENGSNYLSVRFTSQEAYQEAIRSLIDEGRISSVLQEIGCTSESWYRANDNLYIFAVGIGKLPESQPSSDSTEQNEAERTEAYVNGESEHFYLIYLDNFEQQREIDRETAAILGFGYIYHLDLNADGTGMITFDQDVQKVTWDANTLTSENGAVYSISRQGDVIILEHDNGVLKYTLGDASDEVIPTIAPAPCDPNTRAGYYRLSMMVQDGQTYNGLYLEKIGKPFYLVLNEDHTGRMTDDPATGTEDAVQWDDTMIAVGDDKPIEYQYDNGTIVLEPSDRLQMTFVYAGEPGMAPGQ